MANFFEEYMLTPSLLDKFSNSGLGGLFSGGVSDTKNEYPLFQSQETLPNNTQYNSGGFGIKDVANDYINDKEPKTALRQAMENNVNGEETKSVVRQNMENHINSPQEKNTDMKKFAELLANTGNKTGSSYTPQKPQYGITPSKVDYSQFMVLSPETQRYFYRGL